MHIVSNQVEFAGSSALPMSVAGYALFLDVDGTLIDIAASPDAVIVPATLANDIRNVSIKAGGALALVSGRTIETVDRLLHPETFPVAGLHGGEFREPGGEPVQLPSPPALATFRPLISELAERLSGVHVEDKGRAIAVHYRAAPSAGDEVERTVEEMAARSGDTLATQKGKMVIELKPIDAGKGEAVTRFMSLPPFAGRSPIAIGDDITDEEMFKVVNALGGLSVRVGTPDRPSEADQYIENPQAVRNWLASIEGR